VVQTPAAQVAGQAAHVGDEAEEAQGRHFAIARRTFRQVAETPPRGDGIGHHVVSADRRAAAAGGQKACQHLHRGGFARTVGAKEAQHLAGFNAKTDVVYRHQVAILLAQSLRFDHAAPLYSIRNWGFRGNRSNREGFPGKVVARTAGQVIATGFCTATAAKSSPTCASTGTAVGHATKKRRPKAPLSEICTLLPTGPTAHQDQRWASRPCSHRTPESSR